MDKYTVIYLQNVILENKNEINFMHNMNDSYT